MDGTERVGRFDRRLNVAIASVAVVSVALSLGALALAGVRPAASVAVGGALAVAHLWTLARIVVALLPTESAAAAAQRPIGWVVLAAMKMAAVLAVIGLAAGFAPVSPVALVVGLLALPIGIAIGTFVSDRDTRPEGAF